MKGKVFNFKLMLTLLLVLTAGFCFAVGSASKVKTQEKEIVSTAIFLGEEGNEQEFSAQFGGGVIFSAEKVKVGTTAELNPAEFGNKTFIGEYDKDLNTNKQYVFQDKKKSETSPKTVIDNGDFVKFENIYENGNYEIEGNSSVQEAIMISFGSYVYNETTKQIEIADKDGKIHAGITYLNVVIKKDGQQIKIPSVRNISTDKGPYLDFVYLIKQGATNEGFYQISFKYMVDSREETANFEFSLVNNTSYTHNINPPDGDSGYRDFGYNAQPTLGWENASKFAQTELDYNRYYIGNTGINAENLSFPTLTYDYTKYKVSFKHTANQRNTQHDLIANVGKFSTLTWNSSSSQGNVSKTYNLLDYDSTSPINLVTLMFTEPGSYVFTYEYLYNGNVVSDYGFESGEIKLAIYGMSTYYSKANFEGAKMQYFEIAYTKANSVDLIIQNGYELTENITAQQNKKVGFVYTLVENAENDIREGNVLNSNSKDALINKELKATKSNEYDDGIDSDFEYLTINNAENIDNYKKVDELGKILESIKYEETNQGSLWIEGNDKYTNNSFYFYHEKELTKEEIFKLNEDDTEYVSTKIDFTNTTSFNKKGYYLVFLQVDPSGKSDDSDTYWQIFAFRYVSSAVDIYVEAVNTNNTPETTDDTYELVAGGKYTNKEVRISWKKPGIFDRAVNGYYFNATNENYSKEQFFLTTKKSLILTEQVIDDELRYVANLGKDVQQNTFVKYLIRIESEGESAIHKTFTIDKQGISGVQAYLIQQMVSGNSIYYTYATDRNNFIVPIQNAVTDSLATLNWNDKASGAKITASYIYTPFSVTSKNTVSSITGNNSKEWILTNYELGTTIVGTELKRSDSIYNVETDCIMSNQGIYIITLKDDAGNECRYAFVIDRTENYFKLQGQCMSNASVIFGDDVTYSIGDYKAFKLNLATSAVLQEFVEKVTAGNLSNFKDYYFGVNNNANVITNLFQKLGNDYYFTIQNKKVVSYRDDIVSNISTSGELNYFVENGESSFIRTLYAVSENNTYTTKNLKNNSYVVVEINKDNARGMAYYSDGKITTIPEGGQSNNSIKRLGVGSDDFDEYDNPTTNGLNHASATSAKNVAFVWNKGTGNFEVAHVYYTFYSLKPSVYNDDKYYFYGSPETFDLYENGKWENGAYDDNNGRGVVKFNGDSDSKAGLYVVTRVYKDTGADPEDDILGDDEPIKNYYFIVDRNKIIDTNIGGSIRIQLLENEVDFNNFTVQNPDSELFSNIEDGLSNERYNIYLSTNKLPATLNIPTGKYFSSTKIGDEAPVLKSSDGYKSGKLNVSVYFNDINKQLTGQFKGATVKIYGSTKGCEVKDNCFVIDIYKYLTDVNVELRNRIAKRGEDQGTWLFLPGDYIVRLTDNVQNFAGETHTVYIGFRITGTQDKGPKVDAFTGFDDENMTKVVTTADGIVNNNHFEYSATVSQEYLKVVLPNYVSNVANNAQVDPNYVVIKQYYGENAIAEDYINHPYEAKNGITLTGDAVYEKYVTINADNSINLWLDTKLKVNDEIDVANLNKPLKYVVTVRYKIGVSGDNERYKDCYIFYKADGTKVSYFEATYTIEIDRIAPTQNIDMLNRTDKLVKEYNQEFGTVSMTENNFHETSSNIYFTHQYAKYYQKQKEDKSYIYPYQVYSNTEFKVKDVTGNLDVVKVLFRRISVSSLMDLKSYNLTLPLIDESSYTAVRKPSDISVFGGLSLIPNNYYEIVEFDAAGNATQYVIHYSPRTDESNPEIIIPTQILTTLAENEEKDLVLDYENANVDIVNIYNITAKGAVQHNFENFFKIELLRIDGSAISTILTTATTDFDSLTQTIVDAINGERYGNLVLKITTRSHTSSIQINLYDQQDVQALDVKNLVDTSSSTYEINLRGANDFDPEKNLWYFATKIEIKKAGSVTETYNGQIDGNVVVYYKDGEIASSEITCLPNTTYHITMTDVLGTVSNYRFNSSGQEFVVLEFIDVDNDADKDYYQGNEGTNVVYYGFTDATLKYDKTIYSSKIWKKSNDGTYQDASYDIFVDEDSDSVYDIIKISAIYDEITGIGGLIEVKIDLSFEGYIETTYYITIDTRLSMVALRDYSTGEQRTELLKPFRNVDYFSPSVRSDQIGSGVMNLSWSSIEENNHFNYDFIMHEMMDNGTYRTTNLNTQTNYAITTGPESSGIYKFEIRVYGKDGTYLGNRISAFEVQEVSTQIYYVRSKTTGEAVLANSNFRVKDLGGGLATDITDHDDCKEINEDLRLPLYISNQDLEVVVTMSNVEKKEVKFVDNSTYTFFIYKISKENAYNIFIGIMKVDIPTHNLVEKVFVDSTEVKNKTRFTIASDDKTEAKIEVIKKTYGDSYGLLAKNLLLIDVYYMNRFVATEELTSGNYTIEGNGEYSFIIKDLAGNIHEFKEDEDLDNPNTIDKLNVYVLREVVVTINGDAPVENAFYNNYVELVIYSSMKYVTGSIDIKAERNGEPYIPAGYNPYVFTDYGNYRVELTAKYGTLDKALTKVITFTILNEKEARNSIDFTSLSGSKIVRVLNPLGQNVTEAFNNMLANSSISGGMNISYDDIMENSHALNVTSGKISFTLTYRVEDRIYPTRDITIVFTMNNETPVIYSTLEKGETTTKGFEIYFNPLIVYEQIGEAYVYINDKLIAHITEDAPNIELRVGTSFKKDGDGDYYIKLVSSSGVVLDSYKITIKEPLNSWAIIVIIVVVGVVATVTITIIVLRRKMRIR